MDPLFIIPCYDVHKQLFPTFAAQDLLRSRATYTPMRRPPDDDTSSQAASSSRTTSSVAAADFDQQERGEEDELVPPPRYRAGSVGGSVTSAGGGAGEGGGNDAREASFTSISMINGAEPSDVNVALLKADMPDGGVSDGGGRLLVLVFVAS